MTVDTGVSTPAVDRQTADVRRAAGNCAAASEGKIVREVMASP